MGRPTKKTPEVEQTIIDALRDGNTRTTACALASLTRETFYQWLKEFPDFTDAVKKAEQEAIAESVATIRRASRETWQAAAWYLERKAPAEWMQRKQFNVSDLTDAQVIALLEGSSEEGSGEAEA